MNSATNHDPGQPGGAPGLPGNGVSLGDRVRSLRIQDRPAAQPVGRWWLPWALCGVLALVAAVLAFRTPPAAAPPEDAQAKELLNKMSESPGSKATQFGGGPDRNLSPDTIVHESKGYIVPVQTIQVSPKVSGMVIKLNVKEGQRVRKDDVLAVLEDVEYDSQFRKLDQMTKAAEQRWKELCRYRRQEVDQVEREWLENKSQLKYLEADWARVEHLKKSGGISQKEYDQTEADYFQMKNRVQRLRLAYELMQEGPREEKVKAAHADWKQLEAEAYKARWQLDNCTVKAPISGTILTKKAEEGNIVNPIAFNISASLCEMADLYNLEVDLSIAERDISKIFKGQKCKVRAEAFLNRTYWGTVSRLMPTADRAKGAVPVRVKIHIPAQADPVGAAAGLLFVPPLPAACRVEQQAEYLRPDMGALVAFFNARSEVQ